MLVYTYVLSHNLWLPCVEFSYSQINMRDGSHQVAYIYVTKEEEEEEEEAEAVVLSFMAAPICTCP